MRGLISARMTPCDAAYMSASELLGPRDLGSDPSIPLLEGLHVCVAQRRGIEPSRRTCRDLREGDIGMDGWI